MAAGEGRRLRPLTDAWPKPVLPIDGKPVIATLLREVAASGVTRVVVVTGHLGEQVEALVGDGGAFGISVTYASQPTVMGSADAVRRAVGAGASVPCLVLAADTVFAPGDVARFANAARSADGAIAVRRDPPPGAGRRRIAVAGGRVTGIDEGDGPWSGAPLWWIGQAVVERLCLDRKPFELENAFRAAMAAGAEIAAVEIGKTRDLTYPLDLVKENFPYLAR